MDAAFALVTQIGGLILLLALCIAVLRACAAIEQIARTLEILCDEYRRNLNPPKP
jgi:hypothetical protein